MKLEKMPSKRNLYRTLERVEKNYPIILNNYQRLIKSMNLVDVTPVIDFSSQFIEGNMAEFAEFSYAIFFICKLHSAFRKFREFPKRNIQYREELYGKNMFENLVHLIILFVVIFDPMGSVAVFTVATKSMKDPERKKTALLAVAVAALIAYTVLFLGNSLIDLFGVTIKHFEIAGGIILMILGVEMVLGYPLTNLEKIQEGSAPAIASIIATPVLTGPAEITAIIISVTDYGFIETGLAVTIVLIVLVLFLLAAIRVYKSLGKIALQVISTIFGLITLAWGVKFILNGFAI